MKVDVKIPDTLSEITLGQYQKYIKIQEQNEDENFIALKMLEIFCGLKGQTVLNMKTKSIKEITDILVKMFSEKPPLVREFKMNGVNYGFIPNLEDMTFGEYIDLDTFVGKTEDLHKAMGVLYRPITHKRKELYWIQKYKGDDTNLMKDMPMDAVFSSMLFFYHLGTDLSRVMLNYLEQDNEENIAQQLISLENGDGINRFKDSLREILQELKISLN
jgi:hypothetical protein|tara:strand:+ start:113 stop:763 length:651 start_codon:yes stop_codon:yes gene_type:complete